MTVLSVIEHELVRVSKEMVEQLLADEPKRVMLVGLERYEDGTLELAFRTPNDRGAVEACEAAREFAGNFIRYVDDDEHLLAEQAWGVVRKVNAAIGGQ